MFKEEIPGGPENGIYYLQRFFQILARLFNMLFGGNAGTTAPETTTAAETTTLAE